MKLAAVLAVVPLAVALPGCSAHQGSPDGGTIDGHLVTTGTFDRNTDVLLVLDDSGSLAGEQQRLQEDAHGLVTTLEQRNAARKAQGLAPVRYRFAVTTTSVIQRWVDQTGKLQSQSTYKIPPGYDCQSTYDLTSGTPYAAGTLVSPPGVPKILDSDTLAPDVLTADLAKSVQVGVCGSGQEMGLLAMDLALQKNVNALDATQDFPAAGARFLVVIMSDEEDCSDPKHLVALDSDPGGDACVAQAKMPDGGALGPVSHYAAPLLAMKDAHVVAIASLVAGNNGSLVPGVCDDPTCDAACGAGDPTKFPCFCSATDTYCKAQCTPANAHTYPCYCGGTTPGSRYLKLSQEVPDSAALSICGDGIAAALDKIAKLTVRVPPT